MSMDSHGFSRAAETAQQLCAGLGTVIKGRQDTIKLVVTALIADGHVLLEDYPGSGKTTLTKALGKLISSSNAAHSASYIVNFRRIQFTPDMLPGDVLGVNIFDPKQGSFYFMHGPVFAHIVLADEINRTGPKVQAAFLECMAEKQVTIDNVTHHLDKLFFVVGTQNPLDIAGTYPLPLVQLDRFMLKVPMSYVDAATEMEILRTHAAIQDVADQIEPVCSREDILEARTAVANVNISANLRQAMVDIVQSTRNNPMIQFGASTRAALMLQSSVKAWALINGRDFGNEDDLKAMAPYVLLHRLRFHSGSGEPIQALRQLMLPHIERLVARGLQ